MKKIFLFLTILILLIFGLLFTKPGNDFIASMIEKKVNANQDDVRLKVNNFRLTMSDIMFNATIDDNSIINIEGPLSLLNRSVDLEYDINIKDLSKLQNITKQKLNGSFSTKGIIKGEQKLAVIKGSSLVASSNTTYDIKLVDFKLNNILFNMKNAKIEQLLHLVNQPIYAKGNLNLDADIKNIEISTLDGVVSTDGVVRANITDGILNEKVINKELKEDKTPITFTASTVTKLMSNFANTKIDLDSSLANLDVKEAKINLNSSEINTDYKLFVKDLTKLEALTNQKFNGSFNTEGTVSIDKKIIKIEGKSDILSSITNYNIKVKKSKPEYINVTVNKAKIEKLLNLVNQPIYANGLLNITAKIKNLDIKNLDGQILTTILNGKVNNSVVNKQFAQKLKNPLEFKADVVTDLVDTKAISKVNLTSTMVNFDMHKAVFDISNSNFISDYILNVIDLSKLYDVTQTKMRGAVKFTGNVNQTPTSLKVDGKSDLFGGKLNFDLVDDKFKAKIDKVEVKDLTHMLYYPEFFSSKSNIDFDYNLSSKIGKVTGNLINGQFVQNEFSQLINTFAKFDLTKEIYEKVELKSDINKNIINTFVNMQSKYTKITVPNSIVDTKNNTIDALVKTTLKKYTFDTTVKGNLSNPKIKVDTKAFLESKYGQKAKAKVDKVKEKYKGKIEEKLQKKLGQDFKLDNLLNKKNQEQDNKKGATNKEITEAFKSIFGKD